ncbi:unnamed protein product [Arctia plantaginis]|uniref:Uncharacterized protein n=2 Tax=Arctia plantaginis TaxID=874455 RepID=A0A8S1BRR1_ARCPL|nr:unnamed protein product [Arctia plantaginis]
MGHDPDTIFKALRPVPDFDGNPNVLTRFIQICDQIVTSYMSTEADNALSNLCLLNGILNKITGPAASIINSNGVPDNWLDIRNALINNFADQRDETALYNDLSLATQGQRTPQEFYDHCQTLFSTIMTYVSLHDNIPTTVEAKRNLYRKSTMQAFVRGLREPLGSRIRCMRPPTIEKALEYVQEEMNTMYLQQCTVLFNPYLRTFQNLYIRPPQQHFGRCLPCNGHYRQHRNHLGSRLHLIRASEVTQHSNRIEIHNEEISSITVNPSERPPSIDNSATSTAHTSQENPILEVPITDEPLNKFHRQLCMTLVDEITRRPVVSKPFESHVKVSTQISESSLESDIVNSIKEYVNPKVKTALLITPPLAMYKIIPIIQENFKSSAMKLVLTKVELENIKEFLKQQEIIKHIITKGRLTIEE